jgi:cytidylate kinase
VPADDAIVIDSTSLSIDEVVEQILTLWSDRS